MPTPNSGSSVRGVLLGLGAFSIFPVHDALAKWLVRDFSVWQIMFVRSTVILLLISLTCGLSPFPRAYRSPVRHLLGMRALIIVAAWILYYSAARYLALGEMVTIYFGSPILVALMAGPILGEQVSASHWLAVFIGFVGVVIACRPGIIATGPVLMALAAAVLWSLSTILIRLTKLQEPTSVNMVTTNLGFFVVAGMMLPWVWKTPSAHQWAILLSLSVAGAAAQLLLFEALRRATASTIAPLEFTSLAWAFVLGHVVWGDMPDIFVLSGAMLIGVSGFIIVSTQWRATGRLKKADATP